MKSTYWLQIRRKASSLLIEFHNVPKTITINSNQCLKETYVASLDKRHLHNICMVTRTVAILAYNENLGNRF